jgi:uncharacterized membrane protein
VRLIKWSWFGEAWKYFGAAPGVWIASVVIPFLPLILGQALLGGTQAILGYVSNSGRDVSAPGMAVMSGAALLGFALVLVALAIRVIFNASISVIANKQVRGEPVEIRDLFRRDAVVWSMFAFTIIFTALFFVGALAFYLPALLVLAFVPPGMALVADGAGAGESISRAFNILKSDWLGAVLFALTWNILLLVSIVPCGLGLLVTLPMVHILMALMYRDVIGKPTGSVEVH